MQSVWSDFICLVLPGIVYLVCLVGFDLLGTAWCSLFGLSGLGLACLVLLVQSVWSDLICLVLLGTVCLVCLVWFDLLGTAYCSLFGLFGLV